VELLRACAGPIRVSHEAAGVLRQLLSGCSGDGERRHEGASGPEARRLLSYVSPFFADAAFAYANAPGGVEMKTTFHRTIVVGLLVLAGGTVLLTAVSVDKALTAADGRRKAAETDCAR
jgi:hypothetical protein